MDWKIIVTLVAVLAVIAFFAGSSSNVSKFFGEVGEKIGSFMDSVGIALEDTGYHEFSLRLKKSGEFQFRSQHTDIEINGDIEFKMDNGFIRPESAKIEGFNGFGYLGENITLNGTASRFIFGQSELNNVKIEMSSKADYFSASNITIQQMSFDNAQGEIVFNSSVTSFEGQIKIKSAKGSMSFENGVLIVEGSADYISIPAAGIKLE